MDKKKPHPSSLDNERAAPLGAYSANPISTDTGIMQWLEKQKELEEQKMNATAEELFVSSYGEGYKDPRSHYGRAGKLIQHFMPDHEVIYYPGCHIDLSFAKMYPDSRVIHVDAEKLGDYNEMQKMSDAGYEAYRADMDVFIPPVPADVVVIFNAGYMNNEQLLAVTNPDAIVVVNNWHSAATYMATNCPNFQLVGTIMYENPDEIITDFDTSNLGQMPSADDKPSFPAHSETVFAFQRKDS